MTGFADYVAKLRDAYVVLDPAERKRIILEGARKLTSEAQVALKDDEALLAVCDEEQRALVTNNVADFTVIARGWAIEGRRHSGLIFTSDVSMPRGRQTIGRYVKVLEMLLQANPREDAFTDRVQWL